MCSHSWSGRLFSPCLEHSRVLGNGRNIGGNNRWRVLAGAQKSTQHAELFLVPGSCGCSAWKKCLPAEEGQIQNSCFPSSEWGRPHVCRLGRGEPSEPHIPQPPQGGSATTRPSKEVFRSLPKERVRYRRLPGSELQIIRPATEKASQPNSRLTRYEQLAAAGRLQMLPTGNDGDRYTAFHHVLCSISEQSCRVCTALAE